MADLPGVFGRKGASRPRETNRKPVSRLNGDPLVQAFARRSHQRGDLVLGGALADPVDGAVFLFRGPSPAAAEAFAVGDPYVRTGLVTSWRVRVWATVVGDGVRPDHGDVPVPDLSGGRGERAR
jgi:uncharacterized protein YciI